MQNAMQHPWMLVAFIVAFVLLNIGAGIRVRHDKKVQRFAHGERRELPRILPNQRRGAKKRKPK